MDYDEFKSEAMEIALAAGMQYYETPEGNITMVSKNHKSWIAEMNDAGEIERVIDPDGERDWIPELWLMLYRHKSKSKQDEAPSENP